MQAQLLEFRQSDVLVVTQKIVSKAEGNVVNLDEVRASEFARSLAVESRKDASYIEIVLRESRRIVRMDRGVLICETKHGFICANAGVDESNVNGARAITLLPVDSDHSAQQLRTRLQDLTGENFSFDIAVIISDTWGRPWRNGQINMAIGVAGMEAIVDYRGRKQPTAAARDAIFTLVASEVWMELAAFAADATKQGLESDDPKAKVAERVNRSCRQSVASVR